MINIEVLQGIQDKFAESTGLAAVIVDTQGIPVTTASNFTSFCKAIRSCDKGLQRCRLSDARGGIKTKERGKPYPYVCKTGLIDLAAPIILENRYIGAVLCGQVIMEEEGRKKTLERIKEKTADLNLDFKTIKEKFKDIEVMPKKKIISSTEFLTLTANYIAEMGLVNIYQQELIEESRTRRQLEEHLRIKKLKVLQSQVNPHFLFNVLNSIARLALIEDAKEIEDVVYALSDLLRYSLRNIEEVVKLKDEIQCVNDYITIQKKRYHDKFKFNFELDKDLYNINIPLLTIQPILENAIIHGFKEENEGVIDIKSIKKEDIIIISIKDDGIGIKKELLDSLINYGEENKKRKTTHITGIGINNVHKRLQHYFGSKYGLEIFSQYGEGTEVQIKLPYNDSKI